MSIFKRKRKTPTEKEWIAICKKEKKFLDKRKEKKETALNRLLASKVPEKLQHTLDVAFEKAFSLIYNKGVKVIEKTFNKNGAENDFKVKLYANELHNNKKTLKAISKKAGQAGNANMALSGAIGIGMGIAGVGIPDIPIFTAMLMKCVYQIAVSYGFEYESEKEKYFILILIEGAVSYGEHLVEIDNKVDDFIYHPCVPEDYDQALQIKNTSNMLSKELLYMKFLQGVPIVGAVGGAYDVIYMKQIKEYARIKYKKRFLREYKANDFLDK